MGTANGHGPRVAAQPVGATAISIDPDEFASLPGATLAEKIQHAVEANRVVVFGRTTCPFCIEASEKKKRGALCGSRLCVCWVALARSPAHPVCDHLLLRR